MFFNYSFSDGVYLCRLVRKYVDDVSAKFVLEPKDKVRPNSFT